MHNVDEDFRTIFSAALSAVQPEALLRNALALEGDVLRAGNAHVVLTSFGRIMVLGTGKVTASMARALEEILGDRIAEGAVTVRRGQDSPCKTVRVYEAGHPILDEDTIAGSRRVLDLASSVCPDDLVICLFSGGGSTLLEKIPEGLTLRDLQETSRLLLASGATIHEMNIVRRHLSLVKGGQLARLIAPARCLSLFFSDVAGDLLESIASGPTAPDPSSFDDALDVIRKYELQALLPSSVPLYLEEGRRGKRAETLKPGDPVFSNVSNILIGNNALALEAARRTAEALGYHAVMKPESLHGEARAAGSMVAGIVKEILRGTSFLRRPACVLLGGETTVRLRGKGRGGRNQELALAAAARLWETEELFLVASCGTDGIDGSTDAAGGVITPRVLKAAAPLNLDPHVYLAENNSFEFLKQSGGLVTTGPTGTNVMDIAIILVP